MTKDSIKISQEINFNGLPTWVSIGATLLPEDNVIESLKSLQKDISEYEQSQEGIFGKSKWGKNTKEAPYSNEKETMPPVPLMQELEECDSLEILKSYRFTHKTEDEQKYYDEKLETLTKK